MCLIGTVFVVVYILLVYLSRKRISLVILLLTEATNAVFAIPSLVVVPLCVSWRWPLFLLISNEDYEAFGGFTLTNDSANLFQTFVADTVIITLWLTTTIYMFSAGELTKDPLTNQMTYELTAGTSMTIFYNSVITIWSLFFVGGLQYMVIGGAVSDWYFAR